MRGLLHLLSVVLVLPSVALALAFILLGRAIAARSLLGMMLQVLSDAVWIVPWGLLGAALAVLLLVVGGFVAATRRLAGLCVAILGIGSVAIVLGLTIAHSNASWGQLPFHLPAVIASCIGLWLAKPERPQARAVAA